jgi:hypothetical protein
MQRQLSSHIHLSRIIGYLPYPDTRLCLIGPIDIYTSTSNNKSSDYHFALECDKYDVDVNGIVY